MAQRLVTLFFSQIPAAMFPMEYHLAYKPLEQVSMVEYTMMDNAVFHGLLYAAAVCSTLSKGDKESKEITV